MNDFTNKLTALSRLRSHAIQGAVDRRSADAEEVGEFGPGVRAQIMQLDEARGLIGLQLRLLAALAPP